MNREKYVNDKSYREGYLDGRKEGAKALATALKPYLDKLKEEIGYLDQRCNDIERETEII